MRRAPFVHLRVPVGGVEGAWNELARLALSGSGWTAGRVRTAGEALRAHFEAHGGEHTDRDRA